MQQNSSSKDKKYYSVRELEDSDPRKMQQFMEQYSLIEKMRKKRDAPVDSMGCDQSSSFQDKNTKEYRFQTLVSLMISAQTKDQVTDKAVQNLRGAGMTNAEEFLQNPKLKDPDELEKLLYPASFYKRKAQYILKTCKVLVEKYNGDIPNTIKGLCDLPGVGPKMGYLCLTHAWDDVQGIGVDVHVHRISNRLEWVDSSTPEKTRAQLEHLVPKDLWKPINTLLVGFGQTICRPVGPKCKDCAVSANCAYFAKIGSKNEKKRKLEKKQNQIEEEEESADGGSTTEDEDDTPELSDIEDLVKTPTKTDSNHVPANVENSAGKRKVRRLSRKALG